jgi:hypothetical protein
MSNKLFGSYFLLPFCLLIAGCSEAPKIAKVSGTITMNGKPLQYIDIDFFPDVGPNARGRTDEFGKYELRTMDEAYEFGAAIGHNKVTLKDSWPSRNDKMTESGEIIDNSKGEKSRISNKYYDVSTTQLSFDVKAGEDNVFDISVDPRGK